MQWLSTSFVLALAVVGLEPSRKLVYKKAIFSPLQLVVVNVVVVATAK
jgi:hypothetical protein